MKKTSRYHFLRTIGVFAVVSGLVAALAGSARAQREGKDYYKKWLNEDVVYIVTSQERSVFEKLQTDNERDRFIEQFWLRRDLQPKSRVNEFKEEHYRRVAFANEHYSSGNPGWKTDRGMIYIKYGRPAEITRRDGGSYVRPAWEGGGTTSTFPFEVWRYHFIPGLGNDVEIEFVDPTMSGEFRLARNPQEKDALLHGPGLGETLAERLGANKELRMHPISADPTQGAHRVVSSRLRDAPFERLLRITDLERAPRQDFGDLETKVDVRLAYHQIPFTVKTDYIPLRADRFLVPISVQVPSSSLEFKSVNETYMAHLSLYGVIRDLSGRIDGEFEDDLSYGYKHGNFPQGNGHALRYQKLVFLKPGVYKLSVIVQDEADHRLGSRQLRILLPNVKKHPAGGSLILAYHVREQSPSSAAGVNHFVLGSHRVDVNITGIYAQNSDISAYLYLGTFPVHSATLSPDFDVEFLVMRGGHVVRRISGRFGTSIKQFVYGDHMALVLDTSLAGLDPGQYTLEAVIRNLVGDPTTVRRSADFKISETASNP